MIAAYPLGKGSQWSNREIRYSLRSLEMYAPWIEDVVLIGEKPQFLKDVFHIEAEDRGKPAVNIWKKAMLAAGFARKFLWMNDDIFLMQPIEREYPYYHKGDITERRYHQRPTSSPYRLSMANTLKALQARKLETLHYGVHCPIIFEADKLKEIDSEFGFAQPVEGVSIRSIYGNFHKVDGVRMRDRKHRTLEYIDRNAPFFSLRSDAGCPQMERFLNDLYPKKSRWEV